MEFDSNKNIFLIAYPRTGSSTIYTLIKNILPNYISLFEYFNLGQEIQFDNIKKTFTINHHHDGKLYKQFNNYKLKHDEFCRRYNFLLKSDSPFIMKFYGDFIMRSPEITEKLLINANNQYIFLDRKNRLESAISYLVGIKTRKWVLYTNETINKINPVMFNPDDKLIMNGCLQRMVIFDILKLKLQNNIIMNINYEDFATDINNIKSLIKDTFNYNKNINDPPFKKQNFNHEQLILNFEDFKIYFDNFFNSLDNGVPSKEYLPEWWNPSVNLSKLLIN